MRFVAPVEGSHKCRLHIRVWQPKRVAELMGRHLEQVRTWKTWDSGFISTELKWDS
jgi:hypothetical protein